MEEYFRRTKAIICEINILISNISDSAKTMSFESAIPGFGPAQIILLTGLATGTIYSATKKP